MLITKKMLSKQDIKPGKIEWADRNQLLPFDSALLDEVEGDEDSFFRWMREVLKNNEFNAEYIDGPCPKPFETTKVYNEKGRRINFGYGPNGFSWRMTYDHRGNALSYKDSNRFSWTKVYDLHDNLLSYKDSKGFSGSWTYDSAGNMLTFTEPGKLSWIKTYDATGNELTYDDSNDVWWTKTYDGKGNTLTYEDFNEISWTKTYTYYPNGQLHTIHTDGELTLTIPLIERK